MKSHGTSWDPKAITSTNLRRSIDISDIIRQN
jgi:hypothetical protein